MRQHGRVADITSNASLQSILQPGEVQLITTRACDCGTALDQRCEADVEVHTSPTEKLRKRGWSQSKIDRWLENKAKGELNAAKRSISRLPDSLAYWCNVVRDLKTSLSPTSVGLFLHFYSGSISGERYKAQRVRRPKTQSLESALEGMQEDVLIVL